MNQVQLKNISYSHDAMIDMIIANPTITVTELALNFNRSISWISTVKNSDAFRERLAARRAEIIDPALTATVEERWRAASERSLEVIQDKLSAPSAAIDPNFALKVAEIGAKVAGAGAFGRPGVQVNIQPPGDRIAALAERLTGLIPARQSEIIDVEARQTTEGGAGAEAPNSR